MGISEEQGLRLLSVLLHAGIPPFQIVERAAQISLSFEFLSAPHPLHVSASEAYLRLGVSRIIQIWEALQARGDLGIGHEKQLVQESLLAGTMSLRLLSEAAWGHSTVIRRQRPAAGPSSSRTTRPRTSPPKLGPRYHH